VNQEKLLFPAPSSLVHFRESLYKISIESLLSEKLFARASPGFSLEAGLGALANRALHQNNICHKFQGE